MHHQGLAFQDSRWCSLTQRKVLKSDFYASRLGAIDFTKWQIDCKLSKLLELKTYSMKSISGPKESISRVYNVLFFKFQCMKSIPCLVKSISSCKIWKIWLLHHTTSSCLFIQASFFFMASLNEKVASLNGKVASLHMDGSHGYIYFWILKFKNKRQYNTRQDKIIFQDLSICFWIFKEDTILTGWTFKQDFEELWFL